MKPKAPLRDVRLAFVGFGNVGRRFAELLDGPYERVLQEAGVRLRVVGIATARFGIAIDPDGLPLGLCLNGIRAGGSLASFHAGPRVSSVLGFLRRVPADVLLELTTLDPRGGEPAVSHVRAALRRGLHVITANKGPVACDLRGLEALARRHGCEFLYEGAVMDGTPVFNLVRRCLPGVRVLGFRGALNTTTTRILTHMEDGGTLAAALRQTQAEGIAEADPANDIEGWDSAAKGCALANALMGGSLHPAQIPRRGIADVTPKMVWDAALAKRRWRLVARASRDRDRVLAWVGPEALPADDMLVSRACDGALILETDLMGEIGIWEGASGVDQTAYALLSDLLSLVRERRV